LVEFATDRRGGMGAHVTFTAGEPARPPLFDGAQEIMGVRADSARRQLTPRSIDFIDVALPLAARI
jgi:hypothetical protein